MSVSYPTKVILAYRSGGRCALPDCGQNLSPESESGDPINVGEAAHIAGEHRGGTRGHPSARYDPNMTEEERNHYNNLIYICATCHKKIDAIPQGETDYPVERLRKIKMEHERWVKNNLSENISSVTFAELKVAIDGILSQKHEEPLDFSVIPPEQKISQNQLSINSREMITIGLMHGNQVKRFLEKMEQVDDGFIDRLVGGFKVKYNELSANRELTSDAMFAELHQFSFGNTTDFKIMAAGLALLAHLFETCEVFEK